MKYMVIKASLRWRWPVEYPSSWAQKCLQGPWDKAWVPPLLFKGKWYLLYVKFYYSFLYTSHCILLIITQTAQARVAQ